MSRRPTDTQAYVDAAPGERWRGRSAVPAQARSGGLFSNRLLLTGLAVAGLGALAWYYLGPDLKRYLKIRSM